MKKALLLVVSVLFGAFLVGCQSTNQEGATEMGVITGSAFYRERIALPENAVMTVTLEDVSLADAPSKVIAQDSFETQGKQVPLAFELSYPSADIIENHTYNVRVTIMVDGKLRFTTDTAYPVITRGAETLDLQMMLVGVR